MATSVEEPFQIKTEKGIRSFSSTEEIHQLVRASMQRAKQASEVIHSEGSVKKVVVSPRSGSWNFDTKGDDHRDEGMEVEYLSDGVVDAICSSPRDTSDSARCSPPSSPKFKVRTEDGRKVTMSESEMNEYVHQMVQKARANKAATESSTIAGSLFGAAWNNPLYSLRFNKSRTDDATTPVSPSVSAKRANPPLEPPGSPASDLEEFKKPSMDSPNGRFSWSTVGESASFEAGDEVLGYQETTKGEEDSATNFSPRSGLALSPLRNHEFTEYPNSAFSPHSQASAGRTRPASDSSIRPAPIPDPFTTVSPRMKQNTSGSTNVQQVVEEPKDSVVEPPKTTESGLSLPDLSSTSTVQPSLNEELDNLVRETRNPSPSIPFDEIDGYTPVVDQSPSPDVFEGVSSVEDGAKRHMNTLETVAEEKAGDSSEDDESKASEGVNEELNETVSNERSLGLVVNSLECGFPEESPVNPDFNTPRALFAQTSKGGLSPLKQTTPSQQDNAAVPRSREDVFESNGNNEQKNIPSPSNMVDEQDALLAMSPYQYNKVDGQNALVMMSTLSDVQQDEAAKVENMRRNVITSGMVSPCTSTDGSTGTDEEKSRVSSKWGNRARKSPRKSKYDDGSRSSRRSSKRKSPRKSNTTPMSRMGSDDDNDSKASRASKSSVVVDDEFLKVLASKKGTVITAGDLASLMESQSQMPPSLRRKGANSKAKRSAPSGKHNKRNFSDGFTGLTSAVCVGLVDLLDYCAKELDDESTLQEDTDSVNREWIGSVIDFNQTPSRTLEETETEGEKGVFDQIAEELHTIMEVSSESDLEQVLTPVDIPMANQSFSFSQGEASFLVSKSVSNTDNEIEPGWYKKQPDDIAAPAEEESPVSEMEA